MGEEYDPSLAAVQRTITQPSLNAENTASTSVTRAVGYEIRNKIVSDGYTGLSTVLAQFNRPAGTISISEEVQIETSIDFSGTVSALAFWSCL